MSDWCCLGECETVSSNSLATHRQRRRRLRGEHARGYVRGTLVAHVWIRTQHQRHEVGIRVLSNRLGNFKNVIRRKVALRHIEKITCRFLDTRRFYF